MSRANYNKRFDLSAHPTAVIPYIGSTAPSGWLLCTGSIGSSGSGASRRANGDCANLYVTIWNALTDSEAPVAGGRGASAHADFFAGKALTLPDMRGASTVGRASIANRIQNTANTAHTATVLGKAIGTNGYALGPNEMPSHSHSVSAGTDSTTHAHVLNAGDGGPSDNFGDIGDSQDGSSGTGGKQQAAIHAHSYTLPAPLTTYPHNNMQPFLITNYIIKL